MENDPCEEKKGRLIDKGKISPHPGFNLLRASAYWGFEPISGSLIPFYNLHPFFFFYFFFFISMVYFIYNADLLPPVSKCQEPPAD